jgi:hypothetical protein
VNPGLSQTLEPRVDDDGRARTAFTDLVDSTRLVERLGDVRASPWWAAGRARAAALAGVSRLV